MMTSRATAAHNGAASADAPAGTSVNSPKADGISVAGISMMTVPETVGVRILRKSVSRNERASGTADATSTKVASSERPPSATAVTPTPTTASEVPITATYPEPKRRVRSACIIVVRPQMAIAANKIHERSASLPPAVRTMTTGTTTILAMMRTANWKPRPAATGTAGLSSGW